MQRSQISIIKSTHKTLNNLNALILLNGSALNAKINNPVEGVHGVHDVLALRCSMSQ